MIKYWCVLEKDVGDLFHQPSYLMIFRRNYKFKIGDKFYLSGKTGYVQKAKTEMTVYPIGNENLDQISAFDNFVQLYKIVIERLVKRYEQNMS